MKSKLLLILGTVFFVGISPLVISQSSPYAEQVNTSAFNQDEWSDMPQYMKDAELEVVYSDVIQVKGQDTTCVDYVNKTYSSNDSTYLECRETTTYSFGKEPTYVYDIENTDYRYMGNGTVHIGFDIVQNELTNRIHRAENNQRQKQKFIAWFNQNYLYRGGELNSAEFSEFVEYLESVDVESLGGTMKGKRLEAKNLMASSNSRIQAVVKMRDFRSGSVELNDAVAVRLETAAYSGEGKTP